MPYTDPLRAPGEADLTAHVDFEALAQRAESIGARIHGPDSAARFAAAARHRQARSGAQGQCVARQGAEIELALARLTETGAQRHGRAVQGARDRRPETGRRCPDSRRRHDDRRRESLALDGIRHAFFTREGGVSGGLYASLNGGVGSNDDRAHVAENRARMAAALGVEPDRFLTCYQIHSPQVVVAETPWPPEARPRADAIVTRMRALAIGVSTADCGPVLLADPKARVIGAAHAGWRGALSGVVEATVAAMERLGAERGHIRAAIGPMIRQANYEVGPDLIDRFDAEDPASDRFFAPAARDGHALFDLAGYVGARLTAGGHRPRRGSRALHLCRCRSAFSASAAPPTAPRPITAATSMRSR